MQPAAAAEERPRAALFQRFDDAIRGRVQVVG